MGIPVGKPAEYTPWQKIKVAISIVTDDFHTKFIMQNIKMMFSFQHTHPLLKTSGATKYFFYKTSYIGTIENKTTAKCLLTISL